MKSKFSLSASLFIPLSSSPVFPSPLRVKCSHVVSLPGWELGKLQIQIREVKLSRIMAYTVSARKVCIQRVLESRAGLQILAISNRTPGREFRRVGFQQPSNHTTARSPLFTYAWNCLQIVEWGVWRRAQAKMSDNGNTCNVVPGSLRSLKNKARKAVFPARPAPQLQGKK